jgi:TRAP-type mannitol/chloroaromatic compound transport system substrate-binding protein
MTKDSKSEWEKTHEETLLNNRKTMKLLSEAQQKAITTTTNTLENVLDMLTQTSDMYISDIRKLEEARWKLYAAFRTE